MRTATLDLNSRGSFVDDLNSKPGIVMCRDALLHRSHEIQPAFFDSEIKKEYLFILFFISSFFFPGGVGGVWHLGLPRRDGFPDLAGFFWIFRIFLVGGHFCTRNWILTGFGTYAETHRISSNQDFRIEFRY